MTAKPARRTSGRNALPTLRAPRRAAVSRGKGKGGGKGSGKGNKGKAARPKRRLWVRIAGWSTVVLLWLLLATGGLVLWYMRDLPDVDRLAQQKRQPSVTLLASDGSQVASYGDLYGEPLRVKDMSPWLPKAVLAIEDRRFYEHFGLDVWGVARALLINIFEGEVRQGGSTITQQLAKNLFLTPERSLKRKVQEAILAMQLESRYNKETILSLYMNRVYLGAGTYGIDAAAKRFFGKSARKVNLYEAAVIAGLLKAPSRYNPAQQPDLADARAKIVLDTMVEAGFISRADADRAFAAKSDGTPVPLDRGRFFGDWALQQVGAYLGAYGRDLAVQTTLDPRIQAIAERALTEVLAEQGYEAGASEGAVVVLAPDGAVLAMVGGRDWRKSQFNRATQALRQPGSAFKLFVFLAAMEGGLAPDTRFFDQPITIGKWSPQNYNDRYYGEVTLREAFARSLNSVTVQVSERVGRGKVAAMARRLGITSTLTETPALALGASEVTLLELTGAYALFANQGNSLWPYGVRQIAGVEGTTLWRKQPEPANRSVPPLVVDRMTDLMTAVVVWGTGKRAAPGRPAAGKTGTSQDFRDAWFLGFTAELVVGVWVGNDDGKPMNKVTGGKLPAEIWRRVVTAALEGQPARPLPGGGAPQPGDPAVSTAPAPAPAAQKEKDLIGQILEELERNDQPPANLRPPAEDGSFGR